MLSCASIQKLERYAQLSLKRHSVDDFVVASLKDPKRSSVYSLTHYSTFMEALASIRGGTASLAVLSSTTATSVGVLRISDHLVYALSFSFSLIRHALHGFLLDALPAAVAGEGEQRSAISSAPPKHSKALFSPEVLLKRAELEKYPTVFQETPQAALSINPVNAHEKEVDAPHHSAAPTSPQDWQQECRKAVALLEVLADILAELALATTTMPTASDHSASRMQTLLLDYSANFTQACLHLLRHAVDSLLFALLGTSTLPTEVFAPFVDVLLRCVGATVKLARRASSQAPVEKEWYERHTVGQALRSAVAAHRRQGGGGEGWSEEGEPASFLSDTLLNALAQQHIKASNDAIAATPPPPFVYLFASFVLDSATGGVLDIFSLFQRLSLTYATLEAVCAGTLPLPYTPSDRQDVQRSYAASLLQSICLLLGPMAGSEAHRMVVYFRGEELSLLKYRQGELVSNPLAYSWYTYVTSAPIDPTIRDAFVSTMLSSSSSSLGSPVKSDIHRSSAAGGSQSLAQCRRCAMHLLLWILATPLFLTSFSCNENWKSLSKEQRRRILMERVAASKGGSAGKTARDKRKNKNSSSSSSMSSSLSLASSSSRRGEGVAEHGSHHHYPATRTDGSLSQLSTASSRLSSLSQASASSYISFLSLLPPDKEGGGNEEGLLPQQHESADGNTNLPLILLELSVLSLYECMIAFPPALLDAFGLREVTWGTIRQALSLIDQRSPSSHHARPPLRAASFVPQLLDLGYDLQYNRGLGYECLALLFARVVAPRLITAPSGPPGIEEKTPAATGLSHEKEQEHVWYNLHKHCPPSGRVTTLDGLLTHRLDEDLSHCLAVFEAVAPHAVDQHLSFILFTTAAAASSSHFDEGAAKQHSVAIPFLTAVMERLGKSSTIHSLLDAIFSAAPTIRHKEKSAAEEAITSVRAVFLRPAIRSAYMRACAATMDSEKLMTRLVERLTQAVVTGGEEGSSEDSVLHKDLSSPACIALLLELTSLTLLGVPCTTVLSRVLLELTTQMELLLVTLVEKCISDASATPNKEDNDETKKWERVVFHSALEALFHCRSLTDECINDLDEKNLKDCVVMLESELWAVKENVGAVCGPSLGIAELEAHPASHSSAVLPLLVLQRLRLARRVSILLAYEESVLETQRAAVKLMARFVLGRLSRTACSGSGGSSRHMDEANVPDPLALANSLTDEDWRALATFSAQSKKRLHATLLTLFETTLAASSQSAESPLVSAVASRRGTEKNETEREVIPRALWMWRALRTVGGILTRVATDAFLQHSFDEVADAAALPRGASANTGGPSSLATPLPPLLLAVDVLLWLYRELGTIPFWPSVLEHCLHTLALCLQHGKDTSRNAQREGKEEEEAKTRLGWVEELQEGLLSLLHRCWWTEPRSFEALSDVLARCAAGPRHSAAPIHNSNDEASHTVEVVSAEDQRVRREHPLHPSYLDTIGVPLALLPGKHRGDGHGDASTTATTTSVGAKRPREKETEATSFVEAELDEWSFDAELSRTSANWWWTPTTAVSERSGKKKNQTSTRWLVEIAKPMAEWIANQKNKANTRKGDHRARYGSSSSSRQGEESSSYSQVWADCSFALYSLYLRTAENVERRISRAQKRKSSEKEEKDLQEEEKRTVKEKAVERLRWEATSLVRELLWDSSNGPTTDGLPRVSYEALRGFLCSVKATAAPPTSASKNALWLLTEPCSKEDPRAVLNQTWRCTLYALLAEVLAYHLHEDEVIDPASHTEACEVLLLLYPLVSQALVRLPKDGGRVSRQRMDRALREALFDDSSAAPLLLASLGQLWGQWKEEESAVLARVQAVHSKLLCATDSMVVKEETPSFRTLQSRSYPWSAEWLLLKLYETLLPPTSEERMEEEGAHVLPSVAWGKTFMHDASLTDSMVQLVAVVETLVSLGAKEVPAALFYTLHQSLQRLLDSVVEDQKRNDEHANHAVVRLELIAVSLLRLRRLVRGLQPSSLQRSTIQLLCCTSHAHAALASAPASPVGALHPVARVRRTVLALLALPWPHGESSAPLLEASWDCLSTILTGGVGAAAAPTASPLILSQNDLLQVIHILSRRWLAVEKESGERSKASGSPLLWSFPALLPKLISTLVEAVLLHMQRAESVKSQSDWMRVLHGLGRLFYHLSHHVSMEAKPAGSGEGGVNEEDREEEEEGKAAGLSTSAKLQVRALRLREEHRAFALATILTSIFQMSARYTDLFALHSRDTDESVALDLLRVLQRCGLPPNAPAKPIAFSRAAASKASFANAWKPRDVTNTLSELACICIGSAEGKALLRQTAQRLEEQGSLSFRTRDGSERGTGILLGTQLFMTD